MVMGGVKSVPDVLIWKPARGKLMGDGERDGLMVLNQKILTSEVHLGKREREGGSVGSVEQVLSGDRHVQWTNDRCLRQKYDSKCVL